MPGPPRRDPYPADVLFGGEPALLGSSDPKNPHQLVSVRPPTQDDVTPADFGYDAANPIFGKWQAYQDMSLGYGVRNQALVNDKKSRYALGVDTSQQGKFFMGPQVTTATPSTTDATNGILDFFEIGGNLYMVAGRYVNKWVSDSNFSQTGGIDFGSGKTALPGTAIFQASGGTKYAFIPMSGATKAYYFDGTTFTQFATFTALCFCQVGREFYMANSTNLVSKVDTSADPTNEANWTAQNQFRVGDGTSAIVRMWTNALGVLLILKTDGLYSLDGSGQDIKYYGKLLEHGVSTDNGKVVWTFEDDTYVMYNGMTYRIDPGFVLTPAGPERQAQDTAEVRGYISAGMGHNTLNAYGMLYNPDTGHSYLMKYRTYQHFRLGLSGNLFPEANPVPEDTWVGSISPKFTSIKGQVMYESTKGATSGHSRAWIGFSDGSYGYFTLPCVDDPTACTAMLFSTTTSYLYPPIWSAMFAGDTKSLAREVVQALTLTGTSYVQVGYRDPAAASYTDIGTNFTSPGQSVDFPSWTAGALFDFQFSFVNGTNTTTPIVTSFQHLWTLPLTDIRQIFEMDVLCVNGLALRDGRPMRRQADELRSLVQTLVSSTGGTTVVLPDERSFVLRGLDYGETVAWNDKVRAWQAAIHVKLAQMSTTYGLVSRTAPYLVGDTAGFLVGQTLNF